MQKSQNISHGKIGALRIDQGIFAYDLVTALQCMLVNKMRMKYENTNVGT